MTFNDYVKQAVVTCPENELALGSDTQIILHSAVGLMGELVELEYADSQENFREEVGDLWWYFAIGVEALARNGVAIPYSLFPESYSSVLQKARVNGSEILDCAKRMAWYGAKLGTKLKSGYTIAQLLEENYSGMMACLTKLTEEAGMTEAQCWEMNIAKLRARYPKGFSGKKALDRNIENEKAAMKSSVGTSPS